MEDYWNNLYAGTSPKVSNAETLTPQRQIKEEAHAWDDNNAWSAALGAMGGAGTVLIIAALLFIFKRPKKQEFPLLAPMDVGQNVSFIFSIGLISFIYSTLRMATPPFYFNCNMV